MKERPILFSAPMVRAILDGTKTQTRRAVKPQPDGTRIRVVSPDDAPEWCAKRIADGCLVTAFYEADGSPSVGTARHVHVHCATPCPYGAPGDRLWVRESWATSVGLDRQKPTEMEKPGVGYGWPIWYSADGGAVTWRGAKNGGPAFITRGRGRPSIHMPRWASRITLEVTSVRVERVQDISEADVVAEGAAPERWLRQARTAPHGDSTMSDGIRASWEMLWIDVNGRESWDANPWVWVVGFKRVTP